MLHVCPARRRNASNSFVYHIGNTALPSVDSITDLGVTYDTKLMFMPHFDKAVFKAALRAKLILKCFCSRDPSLLSMAFCTFVRPTLEYCGTIWNPYNICDISKIESVQRRFTKRLNGLKNLPYSCRLACLNSDSLYCRRVESDLIMCYKIINNLSCTNNHHSPSCFFTTSQTRGNRMKFKKNHVVAARDGHFFVNHIINIWISLPYYNNNNNNIIIIIIKIYTAFRHINI